MGTYEYLSTFSTASTKRSISGSWQKLSTLSWKLVSSRSWMASVACVAPASLPLRSLNIRYVKKLHLARVISSSPQVPQGRPCKQEINELSPVTSHAFTTIHPSWNISKQSAACLVRKFARGIIPFDPSNFGFFEVSIIVRISNIPHILSPSLNPFPLISIKLRFD